jgi:hypothetical protein
MSKLLAITVALGPAVAGATPGLAADKRFARKVAATNGFLLRGSRFGAAPCLFSWTCRIVKIQL